MNGDPWTETDQLGLRIQYLEEKLQLVMKIVKRSMTKSDFEEYEAILEHYKLCGLDRVYEKRKRESVK